MIKFRPADLLDDNVVILNLKEEWDNYDLSKASYDKRVLNAANIVASGGRRMATGGLLRFEVANAEPQQYPCLAIKGPLLTRITGSDEYVFSFIYDFEIIKD